MNYNLILYVFFILLCAYALSGVNFDKIIKTNRVIEARIIYVILSLIGGHLLTSFIIEFIENTRIF